MENANPDLEETMFIEDEILKVLMDRDNKIAFFQEKLEQTKEQLEVAKEQLDTAKVELDEKNQLILNIAKKLKAEGASNENIQSLTGLSLEEIADIG